MARHTIARKAARRRSHSAHKSSARSLYRRPLRLELLEDRRLLATVTVTTALDTVDFNDGVTSLREAIFATNTVPGADTIDFDPALTAGGPATILLTQGELAIADSLTINGPGASLLTIDAQQQSRIFNITATTGDFTIAGLTLTGGQTSGNGTGTSDTTFAGGAIRCDSVDTLTIIQSTVSDSRTLGDYGYGGGVFSVGDTILIDCNIHENSTREGQAGGGGIFAFGDVTLNRTIVSENSTSEFLASGGGINSRGSVLLNHSTVEGNSADGGSNGGGIAAWFAVTLNDSVVRDNTGLAGGIFVASGGIVLNHSTVSGNVGTGAGGGIYSGNGTVTLNQSSVSGNQSVSGGGVFAMQGRVILNDSNVSENMATTPFFGEFGGGGGIYMKYGRVTLNHSTVTGNSALGNGGGIISKFGNVTLNQSTVSANVSGGDGAGIYALSLPTNT